ncbi:hypothetical protein BGX38DRAFT_1144687 [Terfezia claveryi]|nr:hypothetical protein BGX38DRAFT_1144687 [Terfezia claveryi]
MSTHAPAHLCLLITNPPTLFYILEFRQTNQTDEQDQSTLSNPGLEVYGLPFSASSTPAYSASHDCELADKSGRFLGVLVQTIGILNDNLQEGYSWSLLARKLVKCSDALGENEVTRLILRREGYFKFSSAHPYKGMLHYVLLPVPYSPVQNKDSHAQAMTKHEKFRKTPIGTWAEILSSRVPKRERRGIPTVILRMHLVQPAWQLWRRLHHGLTLPRMKEQRISRPLEHQILEMHPEGQEALRSLGQSSR